MQPARSDQLLLVFVKHTNASSRLGAHGQALQAGQSRAQTLSPKPYCQMGSDLPPRAAAAGAQGLLVAGADKRGVDLDLGRHAVGAHLGVQPERRIRVARRRARCGARTREQPSRAHAWDRCSTWQHGAVTHAAPQETSAQNVLSHTALHGSNQRSRTADLEQHDVSI